MSSVTEPAKGSEEARRIWKQWAVRNRLMDGDQNFRLTGITERRRVFRNGLNRKDGNLMTAIEQVLIKIVHFKNAVIERWPETIRVMLNDSSLNGRGSQPFESWVGPPGLEKRKQATRVWTDLIQFFVLEYHINNVTWLDNDTVSLGGEQGYLPRMGLSLSEGLCDDIMDIVSGDCYGVGFMQDCVHTFCLSIIMQKNATPYNNPLLFWVALLLQTEEFGDQPRLEFAGMKDELTMREKLEAIVHYARVFILDLAYMSWLKTDSVPEAWRTSLEGALNGGDWDWSDDGDPRPVEQEGDPANFTEPYWQAFKSHFDSQFLKKIKKLNSFSVD